MDNVFDLKTPDDVAGPDAQGITAFIFKHPGSMQNAEIIRVNKKGDLTEIRSFDTSANLQTVETYWPAVNDGQQLKVATIYKSGFVINEKAFDQLGNPLNVLKDNTCCAWERDHTTHQRVTSIKVANMKHEQVEMLTKLGQEFTLSDFDNNSDVWKTAAAKAASSANDLVL